MRPQLDAIATLLDTGAADSAVRLLRSSWEPELPACDRIPIYCMWIRGLCDIGDFPHALILARRAASEFPRKPDILTALGNVLDLHGELDEAREAFEVAVGLDPHGALQHYNLGAVLERLGDEGQAEDCYRKALRLDEGSPSMLESNAALGALLRRQGRLEEAEEVYDRYLQEDPLDVEMLVEHGICLSDLGRLVEAIDRFDTALSLEAQHGGALYNKAITLYRLTRYGAARDVMGLAHRAEPNNPLTLAVFGSWVLNEPHGDLDSALRLIYRAIELVASLHDRGELGGAYASLVAEEVFEALWQSGRRSEAREIARQSGRRDWITPHMLETLNRADYGLSERGAEVFRVSVRVTMGEPEARTRPEDWPADVGGYTTALTVIANDEDEAREFTAHYLRNLEPSAKIIYDGVSPAGERFDGGRARGVARLEGNRAWF
ncbi:hypothetical protein PPSIR1_38881 [Plesiocystis pacifica SIR-1]|uniref:Uncharacterized protein n=1 Tax=Plesiocystis pacifica SIR-1 TaxID=391625 RepID=A6G8U9_9BACT|nr:tetratricopeptide repeat protein [Plesiocystis pacifica]EDM77759.1 hypothetical protein PPSIR1_38881 [Plesiocystis pacifica SIR-1]